MVLNFNLKIFINFMKVILKIFQEFNANKTVFKFDTKVDEYGDGKNVMLIN